MKSKAIKNMSECCIKFHTPVCKRTINHLVIEYLKYILYYRGQFPLPLDQLKRTLQSLEETDPIKIDDHIVYQDELQRSCVPTTSSKVKNRTKQVFVDSINKFDEFFTQLLEILQSEEVLEVVMNLGPNMMNPKELHRITLPSSCTDSQYVINPAALQRYRLEFFKTLMHSAVLKDVGLDNPIPISVLLRLKSSVSISEYMELKRFYVPPQKCKQVIVKFDNFVDHTVKSNDSLQSFQDMTLSDDVAASKPEDSELWVKLKSELKGFKNFIEKQTSISSSSFF